jgi:hypothetical protein
MNTHKEKLSTKMLTQYDTSNLFKHQLLKYYNNFGNTTIFISSFACSLVTQLMSSEE